MSGHLTGCMASFLYGVIGFAIAWGLAELLSILHRALLHEARQLDQKGRSEELPV